MDTKVNENNNLIEVIVLSCIAAVGGGVAYLQKYLDSGVFVFKFFLAQMVVSGFCGGLVGLIVTKSFPDWSYFVAGVSGIFGIQMMYLLGNLWLRFFGKQTGIDTSDLELKKEEKKRRGN